MSYTARSSGGDTGTASLSFGQVLDINGRLRRLEDRAQARVLASAYEVEDVRRLTAASAATLYVQLRRARARLALLDASLDLQQRTLDIVQRRAEAGLSADLDVRRAAADLARTRAQRGALSCSRPGPERARSLAGPDTRRADCSAGRRGARDSDALQLGYVAEIEIGEPARLIQRRPDLRAAEARLIAATADVGVQAAELYPSLRLPGSVSTDLEDGLSDGLTPCNWAMWPRSRSASPPG